MRKYFFMLILAAVLPVFAFAQSYQKGTVYEVNTRIGLQNIKVENLKNHKIFITDKTGAFSIEAKTGELLVFTGAFYKTDTVLLTEPQRLDVFLTPQGNMLNEVKVVGAEDVHKGTFLAPEYHNQTFDYQRDKNGDYSGGVSLRIKYFKKDEKKREKQAAFLKDQEQQDEIAKAFNAETIAKYLPLKGKDMDDFLIMYKPTPAVYFNKDFNLAAYLNDKYKAFQKIPADKRNTGLDEQ